MVDVCECLCMCVGGCSYIDVPIQHVHEHGRLCRGKSRYEVVTLWGSRPCTCVSLTVQLALHKEVALLLQVDVTVRTHEAAGVAILIPGFYNGAPGAEKTHGEKEQEQDEDVKQCQVHPEGGIKTN